ncbi:unnamed protein product, partial [Brenthis ino]
MLKILILSLILTENVFSLIVNPTLNETFIHNTYKYDELIDLTVNKTVMHILDFEEDSDILSVYPTRVHVGTNDSISVDYPLLVTASQQKGISSWDLPLVINTKNKVLYFNDMARTLCPHDAGPNITAQGRPSMTLSTSSPNNVTVKIKVRRVQDFYLEVNKEVTLNVTPSTPKYYYFSFDRDPLNLPHSQRSHLLFPKFNYTIPKSVLLTIDSDDDVCAIVSIQSNSCPVFDNERDVTYRGYHFTMTRKGGITVTQSMFPRGFYVVFIVMESDERCSGVAARAHDRRKTFRFEAAASVSAAEYAAGALAALALVLLVALLAPLAHALSCASHETVIIIENEPVPSSSRDVAGIADDTPIVSRHSDEFESEVESEAEAAAAPLTLAGLSRARPQAHSRRSYRYFTSSLTVAVVYALPVVQLLATYQARVRQSGDQDVCYYNFLCALPLGALSDGNHVASNAGYVLLGAAFMLQVRWRQARRAAAPYRGDVGIPEHPGLLYSMGLALVMEGVLSACYHLCPNKMNFQFDSSFMYVTAVLCMVKLYQSRHPDVNASANTTFLLLAFVMAIGVIGIMDPNPYFWAVFTIAHLSICFFLTLKIYYVGKFKMPYYVGMFAVLLYVNECRCGHEGASLARRAVAALRARGRAALRPARPARALLLAVVNVCNWALAAYGMYEHNGDFARHLLAVLLGNTLLHTCCYVALKLRHGERLPPAAWLWLALAPAAWAAAAAFFLDSRTKWSETAARSRTHNAPCTALRVFDSHDLWHLASAAAIFFSFNLLLIIDDPLADTPRHLIPVF